MVAEAMGKTEVTLHAGCEDASEVALLQGDIWEGVWVPEQET